MGHPARYPKSQDYIIITKAILRPLNIPLDNKDALRKKFTYRRLFIRNNVIKEVLLEYPAYSLPPLVFEELRMTTNTDIAHVHGGAEAADFSMYHRGSGAAAAGF
ncbi:unnamed protein product [Rotaria magnacalcarata]|uniref:Uncharacterized protein n=2 Tax=Rotaria TaxID=231623 RepID=A0A815TAC3_9BILA|nr:unnamed protein product [Rotaria magnacalcarata]